MAVALFTRFVNLRGMTNVNNISAVVPLLNATEQLRVLKPCRANSSDMTQLFDEESEKVEKMSKVMKIYLQKSKDYEELRQKEILEYDIGKRHLANMMGEDIETFDKQKISKSIKYLFPSGVFDFRARPKMYHPNILYPIKNGAEFDELGRPKHTFFYTCKPNFYEILYNIVEAIDELNTIELSEQAAGNKATAEDTIDMTNRQWISKARLEKKAQEYLTDANYDTFISTLERAANHPYSARVSNLIEKYLKKVKPETVDIKLRPLLHDDNGRPYVIVHNCMRKSSRGMVIVRGNGSGKITINGQDITYFDNIQCREQERDRFF